MISYGFLLHVIENFEEYNLKVDTPFIPIIKSKVNIIILQELIQKFICKCILFFICFFFFKEKIK